MLATLLSAHHTNICPFNFSGIRTHNLWLRSPECEPLYQIVVDCERECIEYNYTLSLVEYLQASIIIIISLLSPTSFLAIDMFLNNKGISQRFDFPVMSCLERDLLDIALARVAYNVDMAQCWHSAYLNDEIDKFAVKKQWFHPKRYEHVENCSVHLSV